MSDHREALARIPDAVTKEMTTRSSAAGLFHLAGHLGLIAVTGTLIAAQIPFWWMLLPLHGILLTFLFALEHECTHQTPFAHIGLNEWVGRLTGLVLILPFTWFRYFHLAHHRHTNDPERDPELVAGAMKETWRAFLLRLTGWRYWSTVIRQLGINAFGQPVADYLPASALPRMKREARWMCGAYALTALSLFWSPLLLWLWVVPMLLGQPFLRLYLMAEHGRCAFVANMLENTRTTYTNRFVRFIAWNMPFHAEHHAAPQVPFHQLPRLNTHLRDVLRETASGYRAFTAETLKRL